MIVIRTLVAAFVLMLAACGTQQDQNASHGQAKVIAVATLMSHPALDEVRAGLTEGLRQSGLVEGRDFRFIDRNANGEIQLASSIAADLEGHSPDVIVPITTPMAQAVHARSSRPIVFAAVTDPMGANLVSSLAGTPRITGTSDAWPYAAQLRLIRRIQPNARRLAVLFNPGEAASQYGMHEIRRLAPTQGFTLVEVPVASSNEVASAARLAARNADALFLSSDNTVISAIGAAFTVAVRNHIPLYVGDSGTVEKGGLAAVSVGYRSLGVQTGRLVARVLAGQDRLPIVVASDSQIYVNRRAAEMMGVRIPDDVLAEAHQVFTAVRP